jgi:hypothetical protein
MMVLSSQMSGLNFFTDSHGRLKMDGQGSMYVSDLIKMVKINLKQWLIEKDICTEKDATDTFLKLGVVDVESVDHVIDSQRCTKEKMRQAGISDEKIAKILKLQLKA